MSDGDPKKTIWEWVRWGITALILPMLIWGWALQSKVDATEHRITELEKDLTAVDSNTKDEVKSLRTDIKSDNERIQKMQITIARMEGKIDNANSTLEKIERLVNTP